MFNIKFNPFNKKNEANHYEHEDEFPEQTVEIIDIDDYVITRHRGQLALGIVTDITVVAEGTYREMKYATVKIAQFTSWGTIHLDQIVSSDASKFEKAEGRIVPNEVFELKGALDYNEQLERERLEAPQQLDFSYVIPSDDPVYR